MFSGYTVLHTERYERLPVENQPATSLNWSNLSPLLQDSNDFNVGERGILDFLNENPPTKNSPSSSSNTTANFISNTVRLYYISYKWFCIRICCFLGTSSRSE